MDRRRGGSGALVPTLALLTTITAVVSSLGAPLVPSIAHQYDVALTTAQWSLTAPLLVAAVATPILGRVAAGRRRRPAILGGLVVVAIGTTLSAGSALSMASAGDRDLLGFEVLVAGRALQGVGMALVPLAIAVARDELAGTRMVRAVALLSVTTVAGAGLGYPLTGLVALVGGLAGAYLLGVLLTLLTLAMAWRGVPASGLAVPARVDWVGALLLSGGVLCLLLGISQGEAWGWRSAAVVGLGATSGVALAAWVAVALPSRHPLVDLRLATRPGLAAPNLVAFVAGIGMYSLLTLTVVLVRADDPGFGLDHSVAVAGLILVPYAIASVVGSRWARRAESRLGSRVVLPVGCLMFLSAAACLAVLHDHLWQALLAMALGGAGSGFTFSSLANLMVPHLPQGETASALAFNQVLRFLGFTIGSAASPAMLAAFGGGGAGFRSTLLVVCGLWVAAGIAVVVLDSRHANAAPQVAPGRSDLMRRRRSPRV